MTEETGPAGINVEDVWGGGKVSRPSAHCCLQLIENKGKGKCYFRSSHQDKWLKWPWRALSIFCFNWWHFSKESTWLSQPQIPRFSLQSSQGLLIASTCLSMNFLSTKNGSRKSRLLEVWARRPEGQATPNGSSASAFLVCACGTRCPVGVMSPQGKASQEPQLVSWGPLSPRTGFLKEQTCLSSEYSLLSIEAMV